MTHSRLSDGKRIVTASHDKTARLWDAETGKPIGEIKGHEHIVMSAAFSPDGKRVVTASFDKTARLWDILPTTQELVSHAKAAVPRYLIPAQRNSFFLPPEPPLWCIELEKWPYDTTAGGRYCGPFRRTSWSTWSSGGLRNRPSRGKQTRKTAAPSDRSTRRASLE